MVAIEEKGKWKFYSSIPKTYGNDFCFSLRSAAHHKATGFYPVVQPQLTETQKKGEGYFDEENEVYTYAVVDKSPEELNAAKISKQQSQKEQIIQEKLKQQVEQDLNAEDASDEKIKANKAFYDYWESFKEGYGFKKPKIVKTFNDKFYRLVQDHSKENQFTPDIIPALWTEIVEPGTVGEWVQPEGAHDAYPKDAEVLHNGKTWISDVKDNVWEPGVYGWTEKTA